MQVIKKDYTKLSTNDMQKLTITDIKNMTSSDVSKITVKQANGTSTKNLNDNGLTATIIKQMGIKVKDLNSKVISTFDSLQIKAMTKEAIANLPIETIKSLTPFQLTQLTKEQINSLTPKQINSITSFQSNGTKIDSKVKDNGLTPDFIKNLGNKIAFLNESIFTGLDANQIQAISPRDISLLTVGQISKLSNSILSSLTPEQLNALTIKQLSVLNMNQVNGKTMNINIQDNGLDAKDIALLGAKVNYLNPIVFSGFDKNQIQALTPEAIKLMPLIHLSKLSNIQLSYFTEEQINALTPKQINSINSFQANGTKIDSKIKDNGLTTDFIIKLGEKASFLSPKVISGFDQEQKNAISESVFQKFTVEQKMAFNKPIILSQNQNFEINKDFITIIGSKGKESVSISESADNIMLLGSIENINLFNKITDTKIISKDGFISIYDLTGKEIVKIQANSNQNINFKDKQYIVKFDGKNPYLFEKPALTPMVENTGSNTTNPNENLTMNVKIITDSSLGDYASTFYNIAKKVIANFDQYINSNASFEILLKGKSSTDSYLAYAETKFMLSGDKAISAIESAFKGKNLAGEDGTISINMARIKEMNLNTDINPTNLQYDMETILTHEMMHLFGINGLEGTNYNNYNSSFDNLITYKNNTPYFHGENTNKLMGSEIELSPSNLGQGSAFYHVNIKEDLMYYSLAKGQVKDISKLNINMLADIGVPIVGISENFVI